MAAVGSSASPARLGVLESGVMIRIRATDDDTYVLYRDGKVLVTGLTRDQGRAVPQSMKVILVDSTPLTGTLRGRPVQANALDGGIQRVRLGFPVRTSASYRVEGASLRCTSSGSGGRPGTSQSSSTRNEHAVDDAQARLQPRSTCVIVDAGSASSIAGM